MANLHLENGFCWTEFCDYAAHSGVNSDDVLVRCREILLQDVETALRLGWDAVIESAVSGRSLKDLAIMSSPLPFESIVEGSDEPSIDLFSEHSFTPGSM